MKYNENRKPMDGMDYRTIRKTLGERLVAVGIFNQEIKKSRCIGFSSVSHSSPCQRGVEGLFSAFLGVSITVLGTNLQVWWESMADPGTSQEKIHMTLKRLRRDHQSSPNSV